MSVENVVISHDTIPLPILTQEAQIICVILAGNKRKYYELILYVVSCIIIEKRNKKNKCEKQNIFNGLTINIISKDFRITR